MERFDSRERVEWAQGPYDDGYTARSVYHANLNQCPSMDVIGDWAAKSWRAGWADADMDALSSQEGK